MADSEAHLSLIIRAKNMAGAEISKTQQSLKSLKTGALDGLGLGFVGVASAAALLTGALIKGVQGAVEEEAQLKRLRTALQANIPAWKGDTKAIDAAVLARENLGFSDDALRESLIKLVPATKNVNKALDVQTVAMDLARFKNISLEDATDALVKVEAGQYRMLKSLGIVLKDGATQTEALAAVQKVAMGQAASYADTLAGKTETLGVKFDDLTERAGGALVPALDSVATATLGVMDAMDPEQPIEFADRLETLGDVARYITNPSLALVTQSQGKLNDKLKTGGNLAYNNAPLFGGYGSALAEQVRPTNNLTTATRELTGALKLSGQEALDLVNMMIDIRREDEYLFKTRNRRRTSLRGNWGAAGAAPDIDRNADGGWVGLNGPQLSWLGEEGPEYVVPNDKLGAMRRPAGVTIEGVTEDQIMDIVDRGMYVRLRRAGSVR